MAARSAPGGTAPAGAGAGPPRGAAARVRPHVVREPARHRLVGLPLAQGGVRDPGGRPRGRGVLGAAPETGARFAFYHRRAGIARDDGPAAHPGRQHVADTDAATDALDGITHGKGTAALDQVERRWGASSFGTAVRDLADHRAHEVLTVDDLADALSAQAQAWRTEWLEGTGVTTAHTTRRLDGNLLVATGGPRQVVDIALLLAVPPMATAEASLASELEQARQIGRARLARAHDERLAELHQELALRERSGRLPGC